MLAGFNELMEEQKDSRARRAEEASDRAQRDREQERRRPLSGTINFPRPRPSCEVVALKDKTAVILDTTTAYAEMGGQVGDTGEIAHGADTWRIANTQKSGGDLASLSRRRGYARRRYAGDDERGNASARRAIERHHTVPHISSTGRCTRWSHARRRRRCRSSGRTS
jgi:alanyl-tRNA synthetase